MNTKWYTATKKPFNIKSTKELFKLPSSKSQRVHGRCNIIQIQKSSFIADVEKDYSNGYEKYDKSWKINGVSNFLYSYPFNPVGEVKFQRIIGKNSDRVKIILPRLIWERDNGDPKSFLFDVAERCCSWFTKNFHVLLGNPVVCQKPDYAMLLDDSRLVEMAQSGTYKSYDKSIMIDSSAPDCLPEIESKDYDVVNGLADAPKKIVLLEHRMSKMESALGRIENSMSRIEALFSQPSKEFDNHGGMIQ